MPTIFPFSIFFIHILVGGGALVSPSDYVPATQLNHFALKINEHLFPKDEGSAQETLVWCPLSVYSTLDPLIDAAGGSTFAELYGLLHSSAPNFMIKREVEQSDLNSVGDDKNEEVKGSSNLNVSSSTPAISQPFRMSTGLFLANQYKFNEAFTKNLKSNGLAESIEMKSLDLSLSPTMLSKEVNEWINSRTDGLIPLVVQPDNFHKETKLIIVNGVQFKGKWKSKFRSSDTEKKVFYGNEGSTEVSMMFQRSTQDFGAFEKDGFQALKLSYADNDLKLIFIVPTDSSGITKILRSLTASRISQIIEQLEPTELDIYIPRFKVETNVHIKSALIKAGLKSLFSKGEANLTRMVDLQVPANSSCNCSSDPIPLYLNDLVHKTLFQLDEEGTKAGAATAGFFVPLSGLMNHRIQNFSVDKPFIFLIRDAQSAIIFQGVVTNIPGGAVTPQPPIMKGNDSSEGNSKEAPTELKTESPWWIHKGSPEYLDEGYSSPGKGSEGKSPASKDSKGLLIEGVKPRLRFQEPEPLHPEGIRFPHPERDNLLSPSVLDQLESKNKSPNLTNGGGVE